VSVAAEVRKAEQAARWLDAGGFFLCTKTADEICEAVSLAAEDAYYAERDRVGCSGLVSVPTTWNRATAHQRAARSAHASAAESTALRQALRATDSERKRARVAKLRRTVGFSARAIGAALDRPGFRAHYVAMLTLTYRETDAWAPEHITACLHRLRKDLRQRGHVMRYVWVAELQKRGAVHYHVAIWLPHGVMIPKVDSSGWWPHGASNIQQARKAVPYLLKYLSKGLDLTGFPKGARTHGSGGLEHADKRARRWLGLPAFIKARADIHDDWRRVVGGGWSDPEGVCVPSEYARAWVGDRWCCVQVADYGRPFEAAGPFSWINRGPAS
jgi:hypothetical protein